MPRAPHKTRSERRYLEPGTTDSELSHGLSHEIGRVSPVARPRGSVRLKRPPDYWEVRAYAGLDPVTGRDRYVSRTIRGGKRDADKVLAQLVAGVDTTGTSTTHTLNELLSAHIDHLEARGREARTIEGYRTIARRVAADHIGRQSLRRITPKTLDDYYLRLTGRGLAAGTVQRYHALLRAAFRQAMAWGWAHTNPVQLATAPSTGRVSRRIPRSEVISSLIDAALTSRNPENGVALRVLAATGARRGEVCALRWSEVDLDSKVVQIRASIAQMADGMLIEKEPKSHQQRQVRLDDRTAVILGDHQARQDEQLRALGLQQREETYVFADLLDDATGQTPIPPSRLTQAFGRLRARVDGAANLRLHDLRHWNASTQLDAGEPLPAVAARIGDHVDTLAKVYAHKGHRGDEGAAAVIGSALG